MKQMYCYGCMQPKTQTPVCEHCGFDDRRQNEPHQLPMGTVLQNQYVVGRVLGQGGFGITYIGWDKNLAIPVAIKEYFPRGAVQRQNTVDLNVTCYTGSATEAFVAHRDRFLKEARTLAQLSGVPEIVQVRNFFTFYNTAYIIMEYVQGTTMKDYLKQLGRRMTVQEVLDIMKPVMRALSKVHAKQLIHRDISPDNIMLPVGGGVKLIDFGTVRSTDTSMMTKSTESILKPGFAPIEQYQARGNLGAWTDVYALSATMHYCLTGKIPEDALERLDNGGMLKHLYSVPGMTQKVLSVLEKGLAIRIADRFHSVDEMYQMLYGEQINPPVGGISNMGNWNQPVFHPSQLSPERKADPVPPSGKNQERNPTSGRNAENLFAPFRSLVPENILRYCESVADKPILVETYLNQCVNLDRLPRDTVERMLDYYRKNKPEPKPVRVDVPDPYAKYENDGTIFGRFRGHVPDYVVDHCESVSYRPILVETYLQQCINRDVITQERAADMLKHYHNSPHPAPPNSGNGASAREKAEAFDNGTIFGRFRTDVPSVIINYCESVADKPVLVETHLMQCVNRGKIPQATADRMLQHYKTVHTTASAASSGKNGMVYCSECGRQIPGSSKFCCHCGFPMRSLGEGYPRWSCAHCGKQIPENSKYCCHCGQQVRDPVILRFPEGHCQNCGTQLMPTAKFCFSCGAPNKQINSSKYPQDHCQNCGKKLSDHARFCVYCGTPVNR